MQKRRFEPSCRTREFQKKSLSTRRKHGKHSGTTLVTITICTFTTDELLLANVSKNFRKVCIEKYGLDLAHYYSSPGLNWDAFLKMTGVELELLTDQDMLLFIETGMRRGIAMVSKGYLKAINPLVKGYDLGKPRNYILTCFDANNLYGWVMSLPPAKSGFKWK